MQIGFQREELLKALGYIVGVVERRQTLPILSYTLLKHRDGITSFTGTDLEVETITTIVTTDVKIDGLVALPARKLFDICRALPEQSTVVIKTEVGKATIKSGRSRFSLLTLPTEDFPSLQAIQWEQALTIPRKLLKKLLEQTHFCIAQQDVRYYLNGLLLEFDNKLLRAVATDGHRMAISEIPVEQATKSDRQLIVPRKGINEMLRLLDDSDRSVTLQISQNHVRMTTEEFVFTSKLIDGRYPDYTKVIPSQQTKVLSLSRSEFKETLGRVAILSGEKYRGVRLSLSDKGLRVTAHNPEQEEAQEEIPVVYNGEPMEIGFNVNYMSEATGALMGTEISLGLSDPNSSCIITEPNTKYPKYIIMPMRL